MDLAVKSNAVVGGAGALEKPPKASSPEATQEKITIRLDPNKERTAEEAEGTANGKSGGANGELRSSSGECTSGESKTEKEGETCRGGSLKDSGSQADENKTNDNKSGSAEGSDDGNKLADSQKDDSTQANLANDDATELDDSKQKGSGKKPKLPRPEGICPCPRCTSEDTKFCYYNNYNIKQPRYFCKGCQRYWTEGGMLRNVPVGAGRRNKNAKEQKKADKIAPPVMANPIGPSLNAAGAYAHNRHVLWDGADPSHNGSGYGAKSASDPYTAMPPSYMHNGMPHGMHMASRGAWHGTGSDRTGNGNFSNGGSSNMSTRSYAGTQDIISTDAAGNANGSTVDMSGSGGADSPDGRGRKMRKHNDLAPVSGMHGSADYNHSGLMHSAASGTVNYDHHAQGGSHSYPVHRAATEADQGHTPLSSSSMPVMSADGRLQGQGEAPWMMHPAHHPAAAAAAAYQAAASGQQSSYWSNMPPWNYHWGNSAVAGWAAAAAAVYQAGANSACWPPNGSWNPMENSSITPGAPMGSGPSSMMQHPGMPQQQSSHYSSSPVQGNYPPGPAMMGYPGPSTPWNGNNSMMPMHSPVPSHSGMMHQGRMQSQVPPPGAVSGIPHHPYTVAQQLVASNGQHRGSQGVLGKHMRSFD